MAAVMKAAVYSRKGPADQVLSVVERPIPTPARDEVRVKVAFSGVNPSDVKTRARPGMEFDEVIPHSDGAGIVEAVGPDAPQDLVGRRVWIFNGQWERAHGTAAQHIALPARQVVPLPDGVGFETGASIGIPLMTAYHAVESCDTLAGRTVLVPGAAGAVGFYAAQLARLGGARVIAVVSSEAKAEIARAAGAESVIDYRREDVVERVKELTGGRGVDRIIEVDASRYAPRYGELLAFGGKAVCYGSNGAELTLPWRPLIVGFVSLYFFIVYRLPAEVMRRTTQGINRLVARGDLAHPEVAVYDLDDIVAAHQRVEQGANAKVLVRLPQ
jgi:NADPH2:quinone reductase